jgi:SAM-dependent methyltransferase
MKFRPSAPLLLLRRLARSVERNGLRGAIVRSCSRLSRSLVQHGVKGTLSRAFIKAPVAPVRVAAAPHPFDARNGTDTGGYIPGSDLDGVSLSGLYSTMYIGVAPSTLVGALSDLPFRLEEFTFVDLGCGKGRALLVAAEFPFRSLIGVELSTVLCNIAKANVALKAEWAARISILNEDATTVQYPGTPLLLYLFDPFLAPVLRRVLANLERQLRLAPRETWILYGANPRHNKVLERFPFIREVSDKKYPFSPEDMAADNLTEDAREQFSLYSVDVR